MIAFNGPDSSQQDGYSHSLYAKEWKIDENMEKNIVDSRFVYNDQLNDLKESKEITDMSLLYEIHDLLKCLYNKEDFLIDYDSTKQELIYKYKDFTIKRKPKRYLPGRGILINESITIEYLNDPLATFTISLDKSYGNSNATSPAEDEILQVFKEFLKREIEKRPVKYYDCGEGNDNKDWYSLIPVPYKNELIGEPVPWDFNFPEGQSLVLPKAYWGIKTVPFDVLRNAFLNEEIYLQKTRKIDGGLIEYYPVSRQKNCSIIEKVQEPVKKELEPISKKDEEKWHPNQPQKKETLKSNLNQPNIDPKILEIQQQILDLLCLADKLGKYDDMLVLGNKVSVSRNTYDVGGIEYIYFGMNINRKVTFSPRKHILTAIRESDVPNYLTGYGTLKSTEATIPEVNKKLLIKARNHLEKTLRTYHYGGEEQKGYYATGDDGTYKNIRWLEKPITCKQLYDTKFDAPSDKNFCDNVPDNVYYQKAYYEYNKSKTSEFHTPVIKVEHCLTPLNHSEKSKIKEPEPKKEEALGWNLNQIEIDQSNNVIETPKVEKIEKKIEFNNKDISDAKKIEIKGEVATIYVWDHQTYDHDIVDVYVNGKLLQKGLELKKQEFKISINLITGQENNIQLVAKSTGTAGRCTIRARVEETGEEFTMEAPKEKIMKIDLQRK